MARPRGSGHLDFGGFLRGDGDGGVAGARLDLEHRLKRDLGLFATGSVGHAWGDEGDGLVYDALFGGRWRW